MLIKTNTIIGHRGCQDVAQNNTIEAFLKAKELGAEMVEMDVRRTRDGTLVVWHDMAVGRRRIRGSNYEELLEEANDMGYVLPTFEEVLKALEGKLALDVELKEAGYEEEVLGLILKYFSPSEFVITSYLDTALLKVKTRFPTVKTGLILGIGGHNEELSRHGLAGTAQVASEIFPWKRFKACQADYLAPHWKLLTTGLNWRAKRRGVQLLVWVVDTPKLAKKLLQSHRITGLITNDPKMLSEIRKDL